MKKYYASINELPMYNWMQVLDSNDPSFLTKKGKSDGFSQKAFERIQDQLIDEFGVSEDYLRILKEEIRIEEMYSKQIKTGDRSNQLLIDIAENELEKLKKVPVQSDLFDCIAYLEKYMGFKINPRELTVFEFYKYSKFITKKAV